MENDLTFNAREVASLTLLLDDQLLLVHPEYPDALFEKLHRAGLLVKVDDLGPIGAYSLTAVGKTAVQRVLG